MSLGSAGASRSTLHGMDCTASAPSAFCTTARGSVVNTTHDDSTSTPANDSAKRKRRATYANCMEEFQQTCWMPDALVKMRALFRFSFSRGDIVGLSSLRFQIHS